MFWLKTGFATVISWTSRYWVVNAVFVAFFAMKNKHILLFARQLVMWIMMLVSPTPGGSGFSEYIFSQCSLPIIYKVVGHTKPDKGIAVFFIAPNPPSILVTL